MDDDQERAFEFVVSLRDFYGDYHAKKEREAYATGILYLGVTAAFLVRPPAQHQGLLLLGLVGATVLALALVGFQLYHRDGSPLGWWPRAPPLGRGG